LETTPTGPDIATSPGIKPILAAVQAGKTVAIANKEPLVMAGELLLGETKRSGSKLIPIDSEHSGLWQCLEGRPKKTLKKLVLTSSGGPFFGKKIDFRKVTFRQALNHPRWKMGPKITIDSATLMNKGLEVIEACNLFEVPVSMQQHDICFDRNLGNTAIHGAEDGDAFSP